MRELLFRGIILIPTELFSGWWYGDLIHFADGTVGIRQQETCEIMHVYSATVGQFTGMLDKNGTKIFEGDYDIDGNLIAWCDSCNGYQLSGYDIEGKEIYLKCHRCDGNFDINEFIEDFEIIGNIHDK